MRDIVEYFIHNAVGIKTAVFTAATTDLCTSATHGLRNGDMVVLTTVTTLPAGLALATVYWVIEATTNTFKLSATSVPYHTTGVVGEIYTPVDITDTGTGAHTFTMHDIGRNIYVGDHLHAILSYDTDGGGDATMTVKFQGSVGKSVAAIDDCPDFSAAQSSTNSWDYVEVIDLQSGTAINGDTGIAVATDDDNRTLEANINGLDWLNAIISGWSEGEVTVKVKLYNP